MKRMVMCKPVRVLGKHVLKQIACKFVDVGIIELFGARDQQQWHDMRSRRFLAQRACRLSALIDKKEFGGTKKARAWLSVPQDQTRFFHKCNPQKRQGKFEIENRLTRRGTDAATEPPHPETWCSISARGLHASCHRDFHLSKHQNSVVWHHRYDPLFVALKPRSILNVAIIMCDEPWTYGVLHPGSRSHLGTNRWDDFVPILLH